MATDPTSAYAHCGVLLRERDRDRYWSALFASAQHRPHLFALYAFAAEVAAIRDAVSAPMPGEIRLQWWRDAIGGEARGDVAAHPVAAALADTIDRFSLPRQAFLDLIDARVFDLYEDLMPTLGDLEGYLGETSSALMRLASLILADGKDPGFSDAAGHAGLAYGLTGLLRALPWDARAGRIYLPRDLLDEHRVSREDVVRGHGTRGLDDVVHNLVVDAGRHRGEAARLLTGLPSRLRPAFLPVALVPHDLKTLKKIDNSLALNEARLPLTSLWTLWRAHRRGF